MCTEASRPYEHYDDNDAMAISQQCSPWVFSRGYCLLTSQKTNISDSGDLLYKLILYNRFNCASCTLHYSFAILNIPIPAPTTRPLRFSAFSPEP